jgi:RNA polymerase sigma-70 factor (sigma-E family)
VLAEPAGFRDFVVARSPALLRTAWMLTGDAGAAEDLLQVALARTWPHWHRVADGQPEAYVRRVLVRAHASWRSRRWHGESPTVDLADRAGASPDEHSGTEQRLVLAAALATLPVRQRQAVVLRYFDDLSVESVAEIMGSSPGTVKSQSAKGLAKLRDALADREQDEPTPSRNVEANP